MKKLVILFIMFISLLCLDINIVSAANNSIIINHFSNTEEEISEAVKNKNMAIIEYTINNAEGKVVENKRSIVYDSPFELCSKEEYCKAGNEIKIKIYPKKAKFISSQMSLNENEVKYTELEDGKLEYSFTINSEIDTIGVIDYTTKPGIDDSYVTITTKELDDYSYSNNHNFMVYVDAGNVKVPVGTILNLNYFSLNEYVHEVKEGTTYYLVPMNSFRKEIVSYDIGHYDYDKRELVIDESLNFKPVFNDLENAIKITPKKSESMYVVLNLKDPEETVNIKTKQINGWELPKSHFTNNYGFTYYVFVYDNIMKKYVDYNSYYGEENFDLKLVPNQKYLITTRGSDKFDMSYFEYKNKDKKIKKNLKDYTYTEFRNSDNWLENRLSNGIEIEIKDGDKATLDLYGNAYASVSYVLKYVDQDPNGITHANKSHYLSFNRGSYYKLLEEKDGKRVYIANGDNCSEEKEGTNDCIHYKTLKVDTNGYTTIYFPFGWSHEFMYKGTEDRYQKGYIDSTNESDSPYTVGYKTTRVYYAQYVNPYAIKNIKKTDQEGRPVDAKFNIMVSEFGANIDRKYYKVYKYVYNHYDEREINGKVYKNVYEVKDIIPEEQETEDSIIETKNGEFTLYYPIGFKHIREEDVKDRYYSASSEYTYFQYVNEIDAADGHIINTEPTILKSYWKYSLWEMSKYQTPNNGLHKMDIKNMDDFDLDEYIKEHWNDDKYLEHYKEEIPFEEILINNTYEDNENEAMFDTKQNRTIVNKKVPTIKKTIEGNGPKDKEYTFLVYEKESNELVETIKVKANEEGYLDITKLVNGKTYIIREKIDSEDYTNTKIEVLNGESKEDKDGKYYEFTYDEELTKVYEANFYNKYKEITVPDTGDNIIIFIVLGIVSLVSILLVVLKLKKVNK